MARKEYRAWKVSVKTRDNFTCCICGAKNKVMHTDHIKPYELFPNLRLDISNGRTLCKSCHYNTFKDFCVWAKRVGWSWRKATRASADKLAEMAAIWERS